MFSCNKLFIFFQPVNIVIGFECALKTMVRIFNTILHQAIKEWVSLVEIRKFREPLNID